MSERSARGLLRFTALATAAVLALGGASTALAQEDPTSSAPTPTETVTPPPSSSTPEPTPPASTEPTAPSSTEPAPPSDPAPPVAPPAATVEPAKPQEQKVEARQAAPDLQLSVKFDRPEFTQGDPISLTVNVRNAGDAPANQIRFASDLYAIYLTTGVDELVSRPSLAPGESKTIKLGATTEGQLGDRIALTLRAYVEGATDKTPNDNQVRAEAKFVKKTGRLSGVVYEDKNGNGVADPGENAPNYLQLKLTGGPDFPGSTFYVYDGKFSFWDMPAGTYQARVAAAYNPDGIAVSPGQFIVVKNGESTEVALRLGPTLARTLQVSGYSFDKAKYLKGDPISVTVNLRNTGTKPITNLVAVCDPENDPATLDGTGPGWGELRPDRGGITIGVGETKSVTVTDTVPDADFPTGKVYFACAFSVDGRNIEGKYGSPGYSDPGLTAGAAVAGTIGTVSGRVLRNGTPVSNQQVKVVAFNAANRIVGDAQTYDMTARWSMSNVPQGKVALQVVGRWKLADGSAQRLVNAVGDQDVSVDLEVVDGPEVKDPTFFAPDLKVSVTFDKETYDISDPVRMTLKVENIGTGKNPARGDWRNPYVEEQPYFDYQQIRKFVEAPIELWPGESKQIILTGKARDGGSDPEKLRTLRYAAEVGTQSADPNPGNNKAEARAAVGWGSGSLTVFFYGDRNLNGQPDAGEELANRNMRIGGGRPYVNVNGKTDASGKVRFTGLPAGSYGAWDSIESQGGWVDSGPSPDAVVNPGDEDTLSIRLVRPLSDKLKATLKFDQPSYPAGARVGITATITNNTDKPVQIKADCGSAWGSHLGNETDEWGVLKKNGPGVEVAVGATYTHRVSSAMPADSPDYGYVGISCGIGLEGNSGNPWVSAETRVPGVTQTFRGMVVTGAWENPQPVPNVKLVLLDPDTNQPVASTTADADGKWIFPDLAVGAYKPVVVGPWRVKDELWQEGEGFINVRGRNEPNPLWVDPGPVVADPEVVTSGGGPGKGGKHTGLLPAKKMKTLKTIRNTSALANTGVSVLGLVLFGGLLVLAGAAMRRRPAVR
ncbi:carboxypeptidase-like regulatory domain-containing protein [Lentzea sp. NPDC005914]|uniref:carboxypeptidase-like regulatory domain-containing protein n=1 Tax=Lentzea sp. NPDC005914 TaxID=3154572 RepID=UPI00340F6982